MSTLHLVPTQVLKRIFAMPKPSSGENITHYRILGAQEKINASVSINGWSRDIDLYLFSVEQPFQAKRRSRWSTDTDSRLLGVHWIDLPGASDAQ